MSREIPELVRAAAGLAATVLDEARKLPETLPGLPVRLIGLAMQQAMKVQQQYAGLVARGDELFTGLRGEDEPGLATFDDDEPLPAATGYRDSAFDRARDTEPTSASAEFVVDVAVERFTAEEVGRQVDGAQQSIDALAEQAPDTEAILDEIAIDEMVDQAPTLQETTPAPTAKKAPAKAAKSAKAPKPGKATKPREAAAKAAEDSPATEAAQESALLEAALSAPAAESAPTDDVATTVDVLTPAGDVAAVEATVTDEGVAAPETPPTTASATAEGESGTPVAAATGVRTDVEKTDTSADESAIAEGAAVDAVGGTSTAPTDEPQGGSDLAGSQAAGTAPIDGYDGFSIAQLRGRLRGYALSTVQDLVAYEEATRARAPYLKMLRNRLEKLEQQAVEASPFAPRGA